jgi:drug/metabolite transporter (DMT)-like permease
MFLIAGWVVLYAVIVAASIIFIGKPIHGALDIKSLAKLVIDWRFILGCFLALGARFIFVIINNLASKHPSLSKAHLTIAALATMGSVITIIIANALFLGERLSNTQIAGAAIIALGIFVAFR